MTSRIINNAAITAPAVSDKDVKDLTNGTLEDEGGFVEVPEETTELNV